MDIVCILIRHADGSGVRLYDVSYLKLFILVGWDRALCLLLGLLVLLIDQGSSSVMQHVVSVESSFLLLRQHTTALYDDKLFRDSKGNGLYCALLFGKISVNALSV